MTLFPKIVLMAILVLTLGLAQEATAADYQVIVNESNPISTIEADAVRRIMLRKTTRWDHGAMAQPIDRTQDASVRETFSKEVLRKSVSAIKAYWQTQIFSGRGVPPAELESNASVIEYVRRNPGAIGYVRAGTATRGVKVIEVID